MKAWYEKHERKVFLACLAACFLLIFLYNAFTPYISDDIDVRQQVGRAESFGELVRMQYNEYLTWNPRLVGQFSIKLVQRGEKWLFNLINSAVFVGLVYLIYANIAPAGLKKRPQPLLYLLAFGFLWRYAVDFGDTILWISGACNYLWTTTIIVGYITLYRRMLEGAPLNGKANIAPCLLLFLFGLVAGWGNENTSGGLILLVLIYTFIKLYTTKENEQKYKIKPLMIAAPLGVLTGFLAMVLAPAVGVRRGAFEEELHHGLAGLASRFHHILAAINEHFFELLCIFIIAAILALTVKKAAAPFLVDVLPFLIASLATCFALLLIPPPMPRAYFGAGVFLIVATLRCLALLFYEGEKGDERFAAARLIIVALLWLWLFFDYQQNLVNLARLYREDGERVAAIEEAVNKGEEIAIVPQFRPEFANRYSSVHRHDMTADPGYWVNDFYKKYYGIRVSAIPREEWEERQ